MTAALSASTLVGDPVQNAFGEDLGKIEELMIDRDHWPDTSGADDVWLRDVYVYYGHDPYWGI